MSSNDHHETNENNISTPPRVEEEIDVETTESGPLVQYDQPPAPIPNRHQMVDIPLPGEKSGYVENGEGNKRKNEATVDHSTPVAKRKRDELSYEYSPHEEFDFGEDERSGKKGILQRFNSNLKQVGKIAERAEEVAEDGLKWMANADITLSNMQAKMAESEKYHQRKFNELYTVVHNVWRAVADVQKSVDGVDKEHRDVKQETFKIFTLCNDTRNLMLQDRASVSSRSATPDYQSLSPTFERPTGPGTSAVRLPGHRSPQPMPDHRYQAPVQGEVSSQGTVEYPPCLFCDAVNHLPDDCKVVGHWKDRRNIVYMKMRCGQCLAPMHKDDEVCPQKGNRCSGCGFKYFLDLNSTEGHHHSSLCDSKKGNQGVPLNRKDANGQARGGGQKRGARGSRGRGGN